MMRTAEQCAIDEARMQRCAELEALLDLLVKRHHGRTPEELQWLPGPEGDRLRQLLDEVREWSH